MQKLIQHSNDGLLVYHPGEKLKPLFFNDRLVEFM